jgi:hypothetical protein
VGLASLVVFFTRSARTVITDTRFRDSVFEPGKELDTYGRNDRRSPGQPAGLTGMSMVHTRRKLALVDVTRFALGTMKNHRNGVRHEEPLFNS